MGTVGLELLSQKLFLVHRSHSLFPFRHGYDERNQADVTANQPGLVETRANRMEREMMQARMNHPAMVVPDAMKTLQALGALTHNGLPEKLLRTGASARQPDQRLQRLRRHASKARQEGRRDRRAFVFGRGLARHALFQPKRNGPPWR
jgi:hypothetical protein